MANEKALTAVQSFALAPISSEVTDLIKEELDGLGQIPFDTVKIPAGGSVTFELSGDDPDNPEVVQTLTGVIVHHHAVNSYWPGEFDGSNNVPDCSSAEESRVWTSRPAKSGTAPPAPSTSLAAAARATARPARTVTAFTSCAAARCCPS